MFSNRMLWKAICPHLHYLKERTLWPRLYTSYVTEDEKITLFIRKAALNLHPLAPSSLMIGVFTTSSTCPTSWRPISSWISTPRTIKHYTWWLQHTQWTAGWNLVEHHPIANFFSTAAPRLGFLSIATGFHASIISSANGSSSSSNTSSSSSM